MPIIYFHMVPFNFVLQYGKALRIFFILLGHYLGLSMEIVNIYIVGVSGGLNQDWTPVCKPIGREWKLFGLMWEFPKEPK